MTKSDDYPLPTGWSKAFSKQHNKHYFVNQQSKETSWIDPRDKLWKPSSWSDCKGDEAPYGWEIAHDAVIGTYFIDHLNKRNLIDDPRDAKPKQQIAEVKQHIENTAATIQTKQKTLRFKKDELKKLQEQFAQADQDGKSKSNVRAANDELESLEKDIEQSQKKVGAMKNVVEELEGDTQDQLIRQKYVFDEINVVRGKLRHQTMMRSAINIQLMKMQVNFESARDDQALKRIVQEADQVLSGQVQPDAEEVALNAQIEAKLTGGSSQGASVVSEEQVESSTRIERELELLALQHQLEVEEAETARLKEIAAKAKAEIQRALSMPASQRSGKKPEWIQVLNKNANMSGTIRFNVKKKQALAVEGGAVLGFREKLLYFTNTPLKQ